MMSVAHLVSRLMVRTPVDKTVNTAIALHDDLSIEAHRKRVAAAQSQIGLVIRPSTPQRKRITSKVHYFRNREKRLIQIKEYVEQNRDARNAWARAYRKKNADKYRSYSYAWRDENKEKVREYEKRCREKKRDSMTSDERRERSKMLYQKTRAAMVARHGLQGWRDICTARSKKAREKKRALNVD